MWNVLKKDVMDVIHEFEMGNFGFERLNKSYLFLLPKKSGVENFSDYRPIALSNSIYLIISKILANRIRDVLQDLIMHVQSTFLPRRSLQESFIMVQEMVMGWHRRKSKAFLWKVDFTKAYDSISWPYLWEILKRRKFPPF
jgi:hypothetical protein